MHLKPLWLVGFFVGDGLRLKIIFKRIIVSEVLTTYLPTFLLILISISTTYFNEIYFEAILSVNLSVLFVMTTLFVSVMEKLPLTSYIRMVDIWLIYGQLVPFLQVALVSVREARNGALGENSSKNPKETTKIFIVSDLLIDYSSQDQTLCVMSGLGPRGLINII